MIRLLPKLKIRINEQIYLKDPDSSELGKNIIKGSIDLIREIGYESLTFKKLGSSIDTTEASIYRYFESKHKLLLYLTSWYWGWLEYSLVFRIVNIDSPEEKLKRAIPVLTNRFGKDFEHPYIDLEKLEKIIISESSKIFFTKNVDTESEEGAFEGLVRILDRVSALIMEINPKFEFPKRLVTTILMGALDQHFFTDHLPSLTDKSDNNSTLGEFYTDMAFRTIKQ